MAVTGFSDMWMLGVIRRGEATLSLDANRHVMNQRRRLAITNSLPETENWTRVAQMAHFVANRCHTPGWLTTFCGCFTAVLPERDRADYLECVRERIKRHLCDATGSGRRRDYSRRPPTPHGRAVRHPAVHETDWKRQWVSINETSPMRSNQDLGKA
jgi:hypothetical protein